MQVSAAPGPVGWELLRTMQKLRRDALWPLVELVDRYGDHVATRAGSVRFLLVHRAGDVERVLGSNQDNYARGPQNEILALAFGQGLLTTVDDGLWRRQRSLIQPMVAKRHLLPFADYMTAAAGTALDAWERRIAPGGRIDVAQEMTALTLDVVGRALFGSDLATRAGTVGPAMMQVSRDVTAAAMSTWTWLAYSIPGLDIERAVRLSLNRRWHGFQAQIAILDDVVAQIIDARVAGPATDREDLLAMLLAARDESGATMRRQQVHDEVLTFMLAGNETTATALTWTWHLLSRHLDARDRLLAEVDEQLAGAVPSAADAERLPWTRAVIQESMRLFPPVWLFGRAARDADTLGGYNVAAGTNVVVLSYLTHRDPAVWRSPEAFDPNRFMPGHGEDRPRHAYIPFGAGRRMCVGSAFAMLEATARRDDRPARDFQRHGRAPRHRRAADHAATEGRSGDERQLSLTVAWFDGSGHFPHWDAVKRGST